MTTHDLSNWQPRPAPQRQPLAGRFLRLEPLDSARHGDELWLALQGPGCDPALWDYLPYGPFASREPFDAWLAGNAASVDPLFYTVIELASGRALGLLSYLRIAPRDGSIEIGHIAFGRAMQRTPASTEAVYLLADLAMSTLGYRRLEWKCNALNTRSMHAAERLGFTYEGLFRQHMVVKGQNRDTAWFSIIDTEWPARRAAFERWLASDNFDAEGRQKQRLEALREEPAAVLHAAT
jgi:RimJ/RimL family protein N-acetyltransferase